MLLALGGRRPARGQFGRDEVPQVVARTGVAPARVSEPGDEPGHLTCWISHQAPHSAHGAIAAMLGMEPADLRVVCPWVGGGFGPKAAIYPEYLVTAAACRALGAPVKWAETRSEDMVSLVHGRDYVMTAKLGVTKDGKFTGLEGDVTANAGQRFAVEVHLTVVGPRATSTEVEVIPLTGLGETLPEALPVIVKEEPPEVISVSPTSLSDLLDAQQPSEPDA